MTDGNKISGSLGTCMECGKRCYGSRSAAKRMLKRRFPGERMSVYKCGDFYHLGHLPGRVIAGDKARSDIKNRRIAQ